MCHLLNLTIYNVKAPWGFALYNTNVKAQGYSMYYMYNVKAPGGFAQYLSNINLRLKLSGNSSRCCENGCPIPVRVIIDGVNGLEKIKKGTVT